VSQFFVELLLAAFSRKNSLVSALHRLDYIFRFKLR